MSFITIWKVYQDPGVPHVNLLPKGTDLAELTRELGNPKEYWVMLRLDTSSYELLFEAKSIADILDKDIDINLLPKDSYKVLPYRSNKGWVNMVFLGLQALQSLFNESQYSWFVELHDYFSDTRMTWNNFVTIIEA